MPHVRDPKHYASYSLDEEPMTIIDQWVKVSPKN